MKAFLAVTRCEPDGRGPKYQDFDTEAEAQAFVLANRVRFPKAFTTLAPSGYTQDWLVNMDVGTVVHAPLPLPPKPTGAGIVARRVGGDPLFAAMIRRTARVEGKTAAQVQAELAAEMV